MMDHALMDLSKISRLPRHIGVIPDGNRRWAEQHGLAKESGYAHGVDPGFEIYQACLDLGIEEMTFYGYTQDNNKRPVQQRIAFQKACVAAVRKLCRWDASLLVVGNTQSPLFPKELLPYVEHRVCFGKGLMKVNFLVNYGWQWDLQNILVKRTDSTSQPKQPLLNCLGSREISRIDLILRWGGRRRLSGFLPVQTIYSDFYIFDEYWPDYQTEQLTKALSWYAAQDITLGG